jgi:N utilization substance protein A
VEWSEDAVQFVTNAISPAKVQRVSIVDEAERVMEVIVEDKQLSLAIGKKGQNVRLAAKLTGWKIDIKSEEEKRREVEAQFAGLEAAGGYALPGIEPSIIATLLQAGYDSATKVAEADAADIAGLPGMDQDKAERTVTAARLTAVTGVQQDESASTTAESTTVEETTVEETTDLAEPQQPVEPETKE